MRLYMLRVARCGCWRPLCRTLSLHVQLCTVQRPSAAPERITTLSLLLYIERERQRDRETERQRDKEMFQMHDVTGLSLVFSHSRPSSHLSSSLSFFWPHSISGHPHQRLIRSASQTKAYHISPCRDDGIALKNRSSVPLFNNELVFFSLSALPLPPPPYFSFCACHSTLPLSVSDPDPPRQTHQPPDKGEISMASLPVDVNARAWERPTRGRGRP